MNINEFIQEAVVHGNRYAEQKGIVYSSEKGTVKIYLKDMNEPCKAWKYQNADGGFSVKLLKAIW